MSDNQKTSFSAIYDSFLTRVTDDMYLEMTQNDTYQMLQDLLVTAIPRFEFPRFDIFDYQLGKLEETNEGINADGVVTNPSIHYKWVDGFFNTKLTNEEINILSLNMVIEWLGQQLATTENTKMKYSGSD